MSKHDRLDFAEKGFHAGCQKNSVIETLRFFVGLIMHDPSHEENIVNDKTTLSISQLITFNAQIRKKHGTPLPVYLGLLVHFKFRIESKGSERKE
jgi:hypothetical protein